MQMIKVAVGAHTGWIAEYGNLYRYLTRHAHAGRRDGRDAIGLVDSSTARWLEDPHEIRREELAGLLSHWIWRILDDTLRAGGVELDPHAPLLVPSGRLPGNSG